MTPAEQEPIRVLIVDDDPDWRTTLCLTAEALGYTFDAVSTPEEAQLKLKSADDEHQPYSVAAIDMNFGIGTKIVVPRGKEIIRYLKKNHLHVACLVVTGVALSFDNVLDLRDEYDIDYLLQKDRIDLDTFSKAVNKACNRVRQQQSQSAQLGRLADARDKWRDIYTYAVKNLAYAREREALKGIDVDVATKNEIELYQASVTEAERQIASLQKEIDQLQHSD